MKKIIIPLLLIVITSLLLFSAENKSTLTLTIENISKADAPLRVGFYKKGAEFPEKGKSTFSKILTPDKTGKVSFKIEGVEHGEWAVAMYHDLNNNNEIEKNFFGVPEEPYGFYRNFKPKLSAPDFEDCSFTFNGDKEIVVELIE